MNSNNDSRDLRGPKPSPYDLLRPLIIVAVVIATVAIVVYLKEATSGPLSPQNPGGDNGLVAHPDTTVTPDKIRDTAPLGTSAGTPPAAPDDSAESDSLDVRLPYDAGYEDGYNTGYLDGQTGDWEASYDETPRPTDAHDAAETYRGAYQLGYEAGFTDGQSQKPFSIIGKHDDEEE